MWRCHIGSDTRTDLSESAWEFLRPYLEPYVQHWVFSHPTFPPDWVPRDAMTMVAPTIDPFSSRTRTSSRRSSRASSRTSG